MSIKHLLIGVFVFIGFTTISYSQEYNRLDSEGKRHGPWKKYFEDDKQVRYEGSFEHGKEVGVFKFYKPDSKDKPRMIKTFNKRNDSVLVEYYNKKGNLQSRGNMIGENREGRWSYYKRSTKEQPVMTEQYKNDKLDGWKKIYFTDGKVAEKTHYKSGVKDGEHVIYTELGKVFQQYLYKNGKLHGKSTSYDGAGKLLSEGYYKQGYRDGEWKFYTDGKLDSIQKYPLPEQRKKRKVKN